jgi:hypothetical protein
MARQRREERRRSSRYGAGVAALLSCGLVSACKDEPRACYGLSVGQRVEVTLVERYDASSQFPGGDSAFKVPCVGRTGAAVGDILTLAVHEEAINCKTSLVTLENAADFGWAGVTPRIDGIYPQVPLLGSFTASLAGCQALVGLAIEERRMAAGIEDESEPGQVPHFVLLRDLVFTDGCAASCSDEFVVSIKKGP